MEFEELFLIIIHNNNYTAGIERMQLGRETKYKYADVIRSNYSHTGYYGLSLNHHPLMIIIIVHVI